MRRPLPKGVLCRPELMGGAERRPCWGEVSDLSPSGPPRRDRRHYDRPPSGPEPATKRPWRAARDRGGRKPDRDRESGPTGSRKQGVEPAGRRTKIAAAGARRAPHSFADYRTAFAGRPPPPHASTRRRREFFERSKLGANRSRERESVSHPPFVPVKTGTQARFTTWRCARCQSDLDARSGAGMNGSV